MSRIVCHLDPGPGVMLCVNNYRGAEYDKPESLVDCEDCIFNPENSRLKRDPKDSDKVIYFLKCGICGFSEKSSRVIKVPGIGPVCRKCGSDYMFKEIKKTKKFPAAVVKKNKARNEAKMKQLLYDFDIKQLLKKANELGYDLVKNMAEKDDVEGVKVALGVGRYIIDEVEERARVQAKKELKFKRELKKFTGKLRDHK